MDWAVAIDLVTLPMKALVTTSRKEIESSVLTYSAAAVPCSCKGVLPHLSSSVPDSASLLPLNHPLDSVHHWAHSKGASAATRLDRVWVHILAARGVDTVSHRTHYRRVLKPLSSVSMREDSEQHMSCVGVAG